MKPSLHERKHAVGGSDLARNAKARRHIQISLAQTMQVSFAHRAESSPSALLYTQGHTMREIHRFRPRIVSIVPLAVSSNNTSVSLILAPLPNTYPPATRSE